MVAVNVVNSNSICPIKLNTIPSISVVRKVMFPVTIGCTFVRVITGSISTSYQLFIIDPPIITKALPNIVNKNRSQFAEKEEFVKYRANQKPVNTVINFEFTIPIFTSAFKSEKKVGFFVVETD